jgi:hypothetical protein
MSVLSQPSSDHPQLRVRPAVVVMRISPRRARSGWGSAARSSPWPRARADCSLLSRPRGARVGEHSAGGSLCSGAKTRERRRGSGVTGIPSKALLTAFNGGQAHAGRSLAGRAGGRRRAPGRPHHCRRADCPVPITGPREARGGLTTESNVGDAVIQPCRVWVAESAGRARAYRSAGSGGFRSFPH